LTGNPSNHAGEGMLFKLAMLMPWCKMSKLPL